MAYTARNALTDALREIGVLAQGETMSADDANAGLDALNRLADHWYAERLHLWALGVTTFAMTAAKQTYSVGTGADVNVARPVYVDGVRFRDTSPTLPVEFQLTALTDADWQGVPIKTQTSTLPTHFWYNPTFPSGTITFWPIPTSTTLTGVLYSPYGITEFSTLDTVLSLPPGYKRAIVKSLALELAPSYSRPAEPLLVQQAADATAIVKRANHKLYDMRFDPGALGSGQRYGGAYNIRSDSGA